MDAATHVLVLPVSVCAVAVFLVSVLMCDGRSGIGSPEVTPPSSIPPLRYEVPLLMGILVRDLCLKRLDPNSPFQHVFRNKGRVECECA